MLKGLDSSAGNELLDKVISQREIMQACKNLKNGKSCGMDGICLKVSKTF
jgi:riboflavin synthase alpha subunit